MCYCDWTVRYTMLCGLGAAIRSYPNFPSKNSSAFQRNGKKKRKMEKEKGNSSPALYSFFDIEGRVCKIYGYVVNTY